MWGDRPAGFAHAFIVILYLYFIFSKKEKQFWSNSKIFNWDVAFSFLNECEELIVHKCVY